MKLDRSLVEWAQTWRTPWLDSLMHGLYIATDAQTLAALSVGIGIALWLLRKRGWALVYPMGVLLGMAWIPPLKMLFGRARPDFPLGWAPLSGSFPSGHVMGTVIFFGLGALFLARGRTRGVRTLLWMVAGAVVLSVGFNRVYLAHHWPTDVIGGLLFGSLWVGCWARFEKWLNDGISMKRRFLRPIADFLVARPKLMWGLVIFYLISPIDVIPEALLPFIGWMDDLAVIILPFLLRRNQSSKPKPDNHIDTTLVE
jgi:membrane-associated phospholipid phosphatase